MFRATAPCQPVSLSVLRRPVQQPLWAVALGEIVDESAATPQRDSLLWYRLACFLPDQMPEKATMALDPEDARVAREDYQFVLNEIGRASCRERVCQYVYIAGVAVTLKKKKKLVEYFEVLINNKQQDE